MKHLSFTRQDFLVLVITVFPFVMVVSYLFLGDNYLTLPNFFTVTLVSLLIGSFSWMTHIYTANILREFIPSYANTARRIIMQIPIYIILTQMGIGLLTYVALRSLGKIDGGDFWDTYRPVFFACLVLNLIATSFHEGLILFDKWKISLIEAEQLKKMHLQSQLDGLKHQVNPHFLFNSLNCLSSLIPSDPDRACDFVDELSKVYRYLLQANENQLVTLSEELLFIKSYFHLLRTRYGESIDLTINISDNQTSWLIAPLTLQLLIENAVKHNSILKGSPLHITLEIKDRFIHIFNNVQPRKAPVISTKIGLKNIVEKYRLMNQPEIVISQSATCFSVLLPLIPNES